jgi:hypothetical protein
MLSSRKLGKEPVAPEFRMAVREKDGEREREREREWMVLVITSFTE